MPTFTMIIETRLGETAQETTDDIAHLQAHALVALTVPGVLSVAKFVVRDEVGDDVTTPLFLSALESIAPEMVDDLIRSYKAFVLDHDDDNTDQNPDQNPEQKIADFSVALDGVTTVHDLFGDLPDA